MLRILYAADNRTTSFYSLKRFLDTYGKFYSIKTAAYSKSVGNLNVNWNLDALLDFRGRYQGISKSNSNFGLYVREIKRFSPHLIISDMELYSSYIGLDVLGIPVWQVSPILLYYSTENKNNLYKYYSGVFCRDVEVNKYINYIINNSNKKLVLSHLGDLANAPMLKEGYDWLRPNYKLMDEQPAVVSSTAVNLADVYFSGQNTMLSVDYADKESIITSCLNYEYKLSHKLSREQTKFDVTLNPDVRFLSQYLKEVDI